MRVVGEERLGWGCGDKKPGEGHSREMQAEEAQGAGSAPGCGDCPPGARPGTRWCCQHPGRCAGTCTSSSGKYCTRVCQKTVAPAGGLLGRGKARQQVGQAPTVPFPTPLIGVSEGFTVEAAQSRFHRARTCLISCHLLVPSCTFGKNSKNIF